MRSALPLFLLALAATAALAGPPGKNERAKRAPRVPEPIEGELKAEPKNGLELAWVPGGSFHFGCEPQDSQCFEDERPGRTERVRGFWFGQTDVTAQAWQSCVAAGACKPAGTGEGCNAGTPRLDHPINCIDWNHARSFCAWIGGRLPTAVEWEFAAKGGESRIYPWGDQAPTHATAKYVVPWNGTESVGNRTAGASKAGLLDLVGNVGQWTSGDYDPHHKEVRGGPVFLRVSNRGHEDPTTKHSAIGLRCVVEAGH